MSPFSIPDIPVLLPHAKGALRLSPEGEVQELPAHSARNLAAREPHILCHKPSVIRHLGGGGKSWTPHPQSADVLELFAFLFPARFCAPSPGGLALALKLPLPRNAQQGALLLYRAAIEMLKQLDTAPPSDSRIAIAHVMREAGWGWGESVLAVLGNPKPPRDMNRSLEIWNRLSEWKEVFPRSAESEHPVKTGEASRRLEQLLGSARTPRAGQFDYAESAAEAFAPRKDHGAARIVLAEAGTGIGKTLGYLAAADIWSQRNKSSVWISTYTKNLQHQLQRETRFLLPDAPAATEHKSAAPERKTEVVLRKGRANYLCLQHFENWLKRSALEPESRIQAGLIALWAEHSADGAVIGGDFPNWLMSGSNAPTDDIRDRNRECTHSACAHYRKCFAEDVARRARKASLVLANHALVMTSLTRQPKSGGTEKGGGAANRAGGDFPARFVFDEGQHLFDVADGVFSAHCNGVAMARLRYWLIGAEGRGARRGVRGLRARVFSCVENTDDVEAPLEEINHCARILPAPGWRMRLQKETPRREGEAFMRQARAMILERNPRGNDFYNLDVPCHDLPSDLLERMDNLNKGMGKLRESLGRLLDALKKQNKSSAALETLINAIHSRALADLEQWQVMLSQPISASDGDEQEEKQIDLFALERNDGREWDVGMHRHWVDPTAPFARQLLQPCQGALITSATLHDGAQQASQRGEQGDQARLQHWKTAEMRTGAAHLPLPAQRFSIASPFDYRNQTRIFLIKGIATNDAEATAKAYGDLFLASGGGALGLFTSIARLRQTYKSVAPRLRSAGIEIFAQHVDAMDNSTLMNIFRMLESSCLLGCDAVRDGVDVPGRGLRLVVLDKPPWPRVDVLHKARRLHFGGREYDMMLTRFRLRQAFGRLIRAEEDRGVFILLTNRIPASLHAAFPQEVAVESLPLAAAIRKSAAFLQIDNSLPA